MEQVALSQKVCSLSSICYFCMPFFSTLQAPCPIKLECSVFHFLIFIFGILGSCGEGGILRNSKGVTS